MGENKQKFHRYLQHIKSSLSGSSQDLTSRHEKRYILRSPVTQCYIEHQDSTSTH